MKKILIPIILATICAGGAAAWLFCSRTTNTQDSRIYIPSGSTYEAVVDTLKAHDILSSTTTFSIWAKLRNYPTLVKSGSYVIKPQQSLFRLVGKLRSGNQDAIRITINKYRTKEQFCQFVASKLEFDAGSLDSAISSDSICQSYGFSPATIFTLFPQNTYEIYWNTSPKQFLDRMEKEYRQFWNESRTKAAEALGLTPAEVVTLASIVEEETNKNDEKPLIASVYLNRLRQGILLQADPTVKYACGDFTLQRITAKQLVVESPYNTYRHRGLPPGPICLPGVASINAVLENRQSKYLYFCAKEDFSGYHNFAVTLSEHLTNAARFHAALNQRGIR